MSSPDPGLVQSENNLLPIEEQEKVARKTKPIGVDLVKHLQKKNSSIRKQDYQGYQQRWRRWLINWLFYEGRQYGEWDPIDGSWIDAIPTAKNNFYITNLFSSLIDSNMKEWARAKTTLVARPIYDSIEAAGAARVATWTLKHEQKRLRTPLEHQGEGLTASMCGVYARYTAYSLTGGKVKGKMPRFAKKQMQMSGEATYCLECGMQADQQINAEKAPLTEMIGEEASPNPMEGMGSLTSQIPGLRSALQLPTQPEPISPEIPQPFSTQTPVCPHCGSPAVETLPSIDTEFDSVEGYDEMNAGQIESWDIDPFEIRVDPSARLGKVRSTPYIYWEHLVPLWKLEAAFPWVDPKKIRGSDKQENNLRYKRNLERSGGGFSDQHWSDAYTGSDDSNDAENYLVCEVWLDHDVYCQWTLDEDLPLDDGKTIRASVPLGEQFPDGLYYCMAGQQLLTMRNEDKNKHWTFGVYAPLPISFWGRGVEDAVREQKLTNDVHNFWIDWIRKCSSPTEMLNASFGFDVNQYSGNPGEVIVTESLDPTIPMSNGYLQVAPPAMPQHVGVFMEKREQRMQQTLGAFSTSSQLDIDITTATGIKLLREANVALVAKALAIRAQVDAEWGQQVIELAQENWIFPHPVQVEDEYGAIETQWFTQADLSAELEVSYEEGSVTPRNEIESRNDLIEAATAFGVPMGLWNPELPPELRKAGVETFGVPFNWDRFRQNERLAKIRCDQLIQEAQAAMSGAQQAQLSTLPGPDGIVPAEAFLAAQVQTVLSAVPIDPILDVHQAHMDFIQQWAHKDEGIYADNFIKEVMRARYLEHFSAMVQQQQMQQQAALTAQAPMMAAQAEMAMAAAANGQNKAQQPPKTPAAKPPKNLERELSAQPNDFLR
ncbi:MAG: hypothetical protein AB1489_24590 [Acidobacteriota bacterium]